MIEKTVLDYLNSKISGVNAYMEVPEGMPSGRFIVIEKTGGGGNECIATATLAIQSYGASMYDAASLNESVKEAMFTIADELSQVSSCRLNSDYNFTDPQTKKYRYQAVYNLVHF